MLDVCVSHKPAKPAKTSERCSLHAVALLDPIWIDKWHQLFPAHWKVGPAPVFGASRPLEPAEWLALLILKAGDVEIICPLSSSSTPSCPRLMGLGEPTSTSRKRTWYVIQKPATNILLKLAKQELSSKPRRPSGKQ